jgi:hypothetical protein
MPETPSKTCPGVAWCPVYIAWRLLGGETLSLWDVIKRLDEEPSPVIIETVQSAAW